MKPGDRVVTWDLVRLPVGSQVRDSYGVIWYRCIGYRGHHNYWIRYGDAVRDGLWPAPLVRERGPLSLVSIGAPAKAGDR